MKAGILIGHITSQANEGIMIRIAEAFGINNVFVVGKKKNYGISQGGEKHVTFHYFKNYKDFIKYCRKNNHTIICLENDIEGTKEISNIEKYTVNPIFVTGNERKGVPDVLLKNSNLNVHIQQGMGYVRCLNTCVACSIVMHDWFKKVNKNYGWFKYDK